MTEGDIVMAQIKIPGVSPHSVETDVDLAKTSGTSPPVGGVMAARMSPRNVEAPAAILRRTYQSNDSEFLTAAQLMMRYGGVSHMWLVRRMANDGLPKPVYFGRLRFWRRTDIETWERDRIRHSALHPAGFERPGMGEAHAAGQPAEPPAGRRSNYKSQ
jgi:predicted DNA-binding transcriptional regulator AlpA